MLSKINYYIDPLTKTSSPDRNTQHIYHGWGEVTQEYRYSGSGSSLGHLHITVTSPRSEPAQELHSRAVSSVGGTSPFPWSQQREQFWRRADKKTLSRTCPVFFNFLNISD